MPAHQIVCERDASMNLSQVKSADKKLLHTHCPLFLKRPLYVSQ